MKTNRSDRNWIIFILILLVLEITWLLADLQWIDLPFLRSKISNSETAEAGYVIKSKTELKRRGANSLVWEPAKENDVLFFKDSILTLSQSSAKIYLNDQTELEMSENTLVTLERPEEKSSSEIRLRFSKGDLRARNPGIRKQIIGDDWIVNLEKGAEVALRKDKNSYEFEIIKGVANIETESGTKPLDENQILKLNDDKKIETVEKSEDLSWSNDSRKRIYTLEDQVNLQLDWNGSAKELILQKVGEEEVRKPIRSGQNLKVNFTPGIYKARLANDGGVSRAQSIEILPAPKIFLKKPLPRDRLPAGKPIEFVWTDEEGVKEYRVQLKSSKNEIVTGIATDNFKNLQIDNEGDFSWKVEATDADGFIIPSFYELPLYIRDEPLQAPKLKTPSIRIETDSEPKLDGAFLKIEMLRRMLLQNALAKKIVTYEILFDWEPVSGADQYVIEVSSTPDFQKPEVIKNLTTTKFSWKTNVSRKYYWRVAAGSSKGKLGLFSEPMEIRPEELKKVETVIVTETKPAEKLQDSVSEPVVINELRPTEAPILLPDPLPPEKPMQPSAWGIAWSPFFKLTDIKGERQSRLKLNGGGLFGLNLFYQTRSYGDKYFTFDLKKSQQSWTPDPPEDFPFQNKLEVSETYLQVHYAKINSQHRFGIIGHETFFPLRSTNETITIRQVFTVGVSYGYVFESPYLNDLKMIRVNYLAGENKMQELIGEFEYKYYLSERGSATRFYIGSQGAFNFQTYELGTGTQLTLHFLFGLNGF